MPPKILLSEISRLYKRPFICYPQKISPLRYQNCNLGAIISGGLIIFLGFQKAAKNEKIETRFHLDLDFQ